MCIPFRKGCGQITPEAVRIFSESADEGMADAQYNLGVMYFDGDGAPWYYEKAAGPFRKASEQGHGSAGSMLMEMGDKDMI